MMMRSRSLLSVIFCTHHCRGRFRWWSLAGTPQWQRSGANKFRRHMQMVYPASSTLTAEACANFGTIYYYYY